MGWIRPPAVAGLFYPAEETNLRRELEGLLDAALKTPRPTIENRGQPKAVIAPHAGYVYSGPVAASAYAQLTDLRGKVERVVLLGPAHRLSFRGLANSTAEGFGTPLGVVPVDVEGMTRAGGLPHVHQLDQAHEGEHSLEVHLPFLQIVLGDFRIVPMVVGVARPEEVAEVLEALWGGPETLIVVSSDLSHYLPYSKAMALDEATAKSIEGLRPEEIGFDQACGRIPIGGLLLRAREEGFWAERVDLRNSGDTAGSRDRVVGYASFLFG
jgi:AmmeMemoRadiSam system protein B